jgi:hypothetical protein
MNGLIITIRYKLLTTLTLVLLLAACGAETTQLPPKAQISVSPSGADWEIVPNIQTTADGIEFCAIVDDHYLDEFFTIKVTDSQERAIGDVELVISLSLSGNNFSGYPVVELYDDKNGDYIPDPDELVSGSDDPLYRTTTDYYSGTTNLIVRMNLSCTYRAQLKVFADGLSSSADLEVIAKDES